MDALQINIVGGPAEFGGVKFNLVPTMEMPADFDTNQDQSAQAYRPAQIRRISTDEFRSGKPVFLLRSGDGITWIMQSFTDHIDHTLTESALADLGSRLSFTEGWRFKTTTLHRDLTIVTNGLANIVPDNLSNMYQGCLDGVNDFDPWE